MASLVEQIERRAMENDIKALRRQVIDLTKRVEELEADDAHKADCRSRLSLIRNRRPGKVAP